MGGTVGAKIVESPACHGPHGGRRDAATAGVSRRPVADLTLLATANLAPIAVPQPDVTDRLALRRIRHSKGQPVAVLPAPLLTRQPQLGVHGVTGTAPPLLKQVGRSGCDPRPWLGYSSAVAASRSGMSARSHGLRQSSGWSPSAATSSTMVMHRTFAPGSLPSQPVFRASGSGSCPTPARKSYTGGRGMPHQ